MNASSRKALYGAVMVFLLCFGIGAWLSVRKPLWTDEEYTQRRTVEHFTYRDILLAETGEGSRAPLFYILQKTFCKSTGYQMAADWRRPNPDYEQDRPARVMLRVVPNVFMSLALALLAAMFLRYDSWAVAGFAGALALSSFMVWAYWLEARPYALWFALSMAQSLIFLRFAVGRREAERWWVPLALVHGLLSLTMVLSALQILVISAGCWILGERRWFRHLWLTVVPLAVISFYALRTPHLPFWFKESPLELLTASIPRDRLLAMAVFATGAGWACLAPVRFRPAWRPQREALVYLGAAAGMILAGLALFWTLQAKAVPGEGFQVSNRYLIYLAPAGIIAVTLVFKEALRACAGRKVLLLLVVLAVAAWLALRMWRTYLLVRGLYLDAWPIL